MAYHSAMRLVTSIAINAAPLFVCRVLTDPLATSACMPGLVTWETLEPQRRFRLVVAWAEQNGSGGLRIPAVIEWTELLPPVQMCICTRLFLGSNTLDINGTARLQAITAGQTRLEISSEIDTPNPVMAQLVNQAAVRILQPFFRCLRGRAEQLAMGDDLSKPLYTNKGANG